MDVVVLSVEVVVELWVLHGVEKESTALADLRQVIPVLAQSFVVVVKWSTVRPTVVLKVSAVLALSLWPRALPFESQQKIMRRDINKEPR